MRPATRLLRPLAFIFAVLLVVGSASPVQAASKKEQRYYSYTSTAMRFVAEDVAADIDFVLTRAHLEAVEDASQDPWMLSTSNWICKKMIAAKTASQRKRVARDVVGSLSDLAVDDLKDLLDAQLEFELSDDETYWWSAMVGAQYVTVITGSQNVLCKGQSKHIEPMIDAYLSAVEEKASIRLGA
jgi:hypothetical protein